MIVDCIFVFVTIFIDYFQVSVQTSSPLLVMAMSIGIFPDFPDDPAFWNFVVDSDHIAQKPSSFPQDTQSKLKKTQ